MPEVETLPVYCVQCGEPVTLHYTPGGPHEIKHF
jgi:hypothetical protein